ncbi:MAG: tetratricopeptide repeat protein [Longimicrobiales bacterium]
MNTAAVRVASRLRRLPSWREAAWLVALVAVALYASTIRYGFTLDDVWIIERNPYVREPWRLFHIWTAPYWPSYGEMLGLYRPLTVFGFALQWRLAPHGAWLFHLVNVVLHAAVCVSILLLLRRLGFALIPALLGALVFAVHPLHVEAVAGVVGQAEMTAALCVLAACYVHASRSPGAQASYRRTAAVTLLFAVALFAKEHAIVLPALLLAIDAAQGRTRFTRGDLARYFDGIGVTLTLLALVAATYLLIRLEVLGSLTGTHTTTGLPFWQHAPTRVMTAMRLWVEYARLLFFPAQLSADYSPAVILPVAQPTPLMALGTALFLATVALAAATPFVPRLGLPAAWFLIAVLPISNLLFGTGMVVAERTLYLPSVALAFIVAGLVERVAQDPTSARPRQRLAAAALAAAILLALGARVVTRNPVWRDNGTLISTMVAEVPRSYRAQWSAAAAAALAGDTARSLDHWRLAYRLWPYDGQLGTEYGHYLYDVGRPEEAIPILLDVRETYLFPNRSERVLAQAYLAIGRPREALLAANRAVIVAGPRPHLAELRARALLALDAFPQAELAARDAVQQSGGRQWSAWLILARSLAAQEQSRRAAAALDSAVLFARTTPGGAAVVDATRRELGLLEP